ncbi:MAG: hypothetical protein AB7I29_09165 [Geobacter sp.]
MPVIRSIFGDDVEVEIGNGPEIHRRMPYKATLVGEVWRGENFYMNLDDIYYLCLSRAERHWVLWLSYKYINERDRIVRIQNPVTWCLRGDTPPASAAAAMLEFVWQRGGMFCDGVVEECSRPTRSGLLSIAALEEIRDIALGIYLKNDKPFTEPSPAPQLPPDAMRTNKDSGIRLRECGPNNPVYRGGWVIGGVGGRRQP